MSKILICYFSASGVTKKVAQKIASTMKGDLFEIEPTIPYTNEDLDWTNKESRSTKEMNDRSFRPPIKNNVQNLEEYDTILIGFPVWWYTAPTIINTFIEENDLTGKKCYIFVTSGGSGVEGSLNDLKNAYPKLNWINGIRLKESSAEQEIKSLF